MNEAMLLFGLSNLSYTFEDNGCQLFDVEKKSVVQAYNGRFDDRGPLVLSTNSFCLLNKPRKNENREDIGLYDPPKVWMRWNFASL